MEVAGVCLYVAVQSRVSLCAKQIIDYRLATGDSNQAAQWLPISSSKYFSKAKGETINNEGWRWCTAVPR